MKQELINQAMDRIAASKNAADLKSMIKNAKANGLPDVARAAQLRLFAILPSAEPGPLEHDVWQSIHALEDTLSSERGKTIRLGRTRPKIACDGEHKTIVDLVGKRTASEGFSMLVERDMVDLTFEAVALRHPERFEENVLVNCQARLAELGKNDVDGD